MDEKNKDVAVAEKRPAKKSSSGASRSSAGSKKTAPSTPKKAASTKKVVEPEVGVESVNPVVQNVVRLPPKLFVH